MENRQHPAVRQKCCHARFGWLLAALVLAVWPAALLHETTTRHAVCPEHGELLDVGERPVASPAGHEDEAGERLTDGVEGSAHEECPFVLLAQPSSAENAPPRATVVPRTEPAPVVADAAERHSAVPLLLLAPKQSPPVSRGT